MFRSRLFDLLAVLAAQHGRWVLLVSVLLTIAAVPLVAGLHPDTSFKGMMGDTEPVAVRAAYMEENFPAASALQVLVEAREESRLVEVAQEVRSRLLAAPERVSTVFLELPVDFFMEHGLLYLPTEDLALLTAGSEEWEGTARDLLADPSLMGMFSLMGEVGAEQTDSANTVSLLNARLLGRVLRDSEVKFAGKGVELGLEVDTKPLSDSLSRSINETMQESSLPSSAEQLLPLLGIANGTLDLLADVLDEGKRLSPEVFHERVSKLRDLDLSRMGTELNRYNMSSDKTALVLDVVATGNVQYIDVAAPFIQWLEDELDQVRSNNPDVTISITGLPVMAVEETQSITDNFIYISLLGFIGILAVFVIGFERVGLPMLSGIPLLMGVLWTAGVVAVVRGKLTIMAMAFPVLMLGIGIDFAIHILSGYSEQRRRGHEPQQALREAYERIGSGLITGAVTTAAAFLVLLSSGMYGIRDMGFVAGTGVLLSLVSMLLVLPSILVMWDRRQADRGRMLPDVPFTFLTEFGHWVRRHRYLVLAGFLAITVTFAYFMPRVELDQNYMNALPQDMPSLAAQETIIEKFDQSNEFVTFFAKTMEEAEAIQKLAEEAGTLGKVLSPSQLIPEDQEDKRVYLDAFAGRLEAIAPKAPASPHSYDEAGIKELRSRFAQTKTALLLMSVVAPVLYDQDVKEQLGQLRDQLNRIDGHLRPLPEEVERLKYLDSLLAVAVDDTYQMFLRMSKNTAVSPEQLPEYMLSRLRGVDGSWMVMVRGEGDLWNVDLRKAFMEDVRRISSEHAGMIPSFDRMLAMIVHDIPRIVAFILGIVFVLVLIDLRSIKGTLLAMTPLIVGMVWTLGFLGAIGMPLNMVSVLAIPIIVGIGIDDGVHLYHRIKKEKHVGAALTHSGKAVILTSLTTGIGFGSLLLSVHPGMYSLGATTSVGIIACLLVSLGLMPALVAIFQEEILEPSPDQPAPERLPSAE